MRKSIPFLIVLLFCTSSNISSHPSIKKGHFYRLVSTKSNAQVLFVENASQDDSARVTTWAKTECQAELWQAEKGERGRFALRNAYSNLYLNIAETDTFQTSRPQYFKKEELQHGWNLEKATPLPYRVQRDRMAEAFLSNFCKERGEGFCTFTNGGWSEAEIQEVLLDMYEQTNDDRYWKVYKACYDYFKHCVGDVWTGSSKRKGYNWYGYDFNDDVMWQIIGAARAGFLSGDSTFIKDARRNFDLIRERATLGYTGLFRWAESTGDRNSTNSCINCPSMVAACNIGIAEADESYFELARSMYSLQRKYLYEDSTGRVYDSVILNPEDPTIAKRNDWASTYNQGTMLGAATLLYQHYLDRQYLDDAQKILAYAKKHLCDRHGIIRVCQVVDGDLQGFKGILMRYAGLYARTFQDRDTQEWILRNALHAMNNSNSRHITHSAWLTKSAEDNRFDKKDYSTQPFGCSCAIAAAFATESPD